MLFERVRTGETLNMLAARLKLPACMIMRANRLTSPAWLLPGREICVPPLNYCAHDHGICPCKLLECPAGCARGPIACRGEAISGIARMYGITERLAILLCAPPPDGLPCAYAEAEVPALPDGAAIITVMPGQSAESLCRRYGMDIEKFMRINRISAPLLPGMRVIIENCRPAT